MRFSFKSKTGGWFKESYRHGLAAKGIRTNFISRRSFADVDVLQRPGQQQQFAGEPIPRTEINIPPARTEAQRDADTLARLTEFRPLKKRKETGPKTVPGGPAYERAKTRAERAEEAAREPFSDIVNQLRFGTMTASDLKSKLDLVMLDTREGSPTLGKVLPLDAYRRSQLASAALDGAKNMVNQGLAPD